MGRQFCSVRGLLSVVHVGWDAILLAWLVFGCGFSVFGRRRNNVAPNENRKPTTENQLPCTVAS